MQIETAETRNKADVAPSVHAKPNQGKGLNFD